MGGKNSVKVYDYLYALDYALCHGPIDSINYVWVKDKRVFCGSVRTREDICVNDHELFGGDKAEGGVSGVIECYMGTDHQHSSEFLAYRMGFYGEGATNERYEPSVGNWQDAPAYPGIAHMFFRRTGTDRGGFKWGTNNPYLPGMKASVTRIPRGLSLEYATIRPLDAVYADGEVPDQQPNNTIVTGRPTPNPDPESQREGWLSGMSRDGQHAAPINIAIWHAGRNGASRFVASDKVGICDLPYTQFGFVSSVNQALLDSQGQPVTTTGGIDPDAVDMGLAFIVVERRGYVNTNGPLGEIFREFAFATVIEQFAETADGQIGDSIGYDWNLVTSTSEHFRVKVKPGARFISISNAGAPTWVGNGGGVDFSQIKIYYPVIDYSHCSTQDESLGELPDANPAHIIYEVLLDEDERDNLDMDDYINKESMFAAARTLFNEGFGISIRLDQPLDRQAFIKTICEHIRGAVFQHPEDGRWTMKLFRFDYDPDTVPAIGMSDFSIKSGSRRAWSQCISEITVEYTNPKDENTASVTAHNDAAAAITGNRTAEVRSYQFIRNSALAQIVADRDVAESGYPLWSGQLDMSRKFWKLVPGDVLRIRDYVDSEHNIVDMIVRVLKVDHGPITSRRIVVDVTEDIFSVDRSEFQPPQGAITTEHALPINTGRPEYMFPFTLPYPMVEARGNAGDDFDPSQDLYRTLIVGSLSSRLDGIEVHGRDFTNRVQSYIGSVDASPMTVLPAGLNLEVESRLPLRTVSAVARDNIVQGRILMISANITTSDPRWIMFRDRTSRMVAIESKTELIMLKRFDADTQEWVVSRGMYDTVPQSWEANSLLWDIEDACDSAMHFEAHVVPMAGGAWPWWGKTKSGNSITNGSAMWLVPVDYEFRSYFPNRPANVQVNGELGPLVITDLEDPISQITVTWSNRNKYTDYVGHPEWDMPNITPEPNTSVTIILRDPDTRQVRQIYYDVPGTSYVIPISALAPRGVVNVEVWAVLDDPASGIPMWSFQASQNYVQIDKVARDYQGWDYVYGRNWSGTATI